MARQRMSRAQRRAQLISIGRAAFAERGLDGVSVEEIAARAGVSKPVLYEHFGGKDGLYRAIVEEDTAALEVMILEAISRGRWRERIEGGIVALLTFVEDNTDGFMILVHGQVPGEERTFSTLLNRSIAQVASFLGVAFNHRGLDPTIAPLYAQALVGTASNTALWWLDERSPDKYTVAAHIANLAWNGLRGMETTPKIDPAVGAQDDAGTETNTTEDE
ncbi:TetR/AcrR family transcriptional regulator [Corynebacterium timonense]|uniref:DNA-binding transcriptional regulator, AcrR family n=1 Tax=Corynebacterium timonense TaxID=441500 RepID=A0A1H1QR58_9CORY|nr:TetR/AcrR family transcriptional regulator [Corynebacterium timonense]SDS25904.1 DNA-binding transcriptional regulator, AcrR family [Corynebacterium timonense]